MEIADLQALATRTRFMREAGIALALGSLILALFFFVPLTPSATTPAAVVTAKLPPDAYANVLIEAKAGIVYDLATGKTLYAKNADAQLPLASLTKLLAVYAAIVRLGPDSPVTIPSSVNSIEPPRLFKIGETLRVADLARLTLTASLNDGAAALALTTAEREGVSIAQMLAHAATDIGLTSTYAVNGNGLDVNTALSGGYGSARDAALLAGALVKLAPDVAIATTEPSASAISLEGRGHTVRNTNPSAVNVTRLLLSKTGFTDLAGGNLALVFDAGIGHPVAVIVLGSSEVARFTDADRLVRATLAHFSNISSL